MKKFVRFTHESVEYSNDNQSKVIGKNGPAEMREVVEADEGDEGPSDHQHRHGRKTCRNDRKLILYST